MLCQDRAVHADPTQADAKAVMPTPPAPPAPEIMSWVRVTVRVTVYG